ncbi:MAG TPA: endonuclease III [Chloroflexota bacterium]|nr:endonuclease III [Chloroflexota bacterium]
MSEASFDIDAALACVREVVQNLPKPALFALFDEGYTTPFEQLVACMISVRTRDEATEPIARRFFRQARTPAAVSRMSPDEIARLIYPSTFHQTKAKDIHEIARRIVDEFGGILPCDEAVLRSFKGVGPKCANLVLGIACGQPRIGVDTHVHRILNRWGYVHTRTPEQTLAVLEAKLPKKYWIEINRLLVPYGKFVCTPRSPRCDECMLRAIQHLE